MSGDHSLRACRSSTVEPIDISMAKKEKKKTAAHKERVAQKVKKTVLNNINVQTAAKQSKKEVKAGKKKGRDHDEEDDDMDIDSVLEQYKREVTPLERHHLTPIQQEALLKVTEELCTEPPSVRSNATLTASTLKNELFLFGGITCIGKGDLSQARNSKMASLHFITTSMSSVPHIIDGHGIHRQALLSRDPVTKWQFTHSPAICTCSAVVSFPS